MTLKIFFLFLGAALTLGNVPDADEQLLRDYFIIQDSDSLEQIWIEFFKRTVQLFDLGQELVIQRAAPGQVEAAVKGWIEVEKLKFTTMVDDRSVIDSLRDQALAKAPAEWGLAIESTVQLNREFRIAAISGDAEGVKSATLKIVNNFRKINIVVRRAIAAKP